MLVVHPFYGVCYRLHRKSTFLIRLYNHRKRVAKCYSWMISDSKSACLVNRLKLRNASANKSNKA